MRTQGKTVSLAPDPELGKWGIYFTQVDPICTPVRVNDHDFRSDAIGVAIPYGIYDLLANRGSVFVGVSHDGSFCCSLHRWLVEARRRGPLP